MPAKTINAKEMIDHGATRLKKAGVGEHYQNSEWMLCHTLKKPRLHFRVYPETKISFKTRQKFTKLLKLKEKGFPLSYIIGTYNFMGVDFKINKNVLIPRPETEELVTKVLRYLKQVKKTANILELCTGSGVISCIFALRQKNIKITAVDICPKALKTAELNAKKLKVNKKIKFIKSDLSENISEKFDLIVANPPYCSIKEMAKIQKEVSFEPKLALYAGYDGLKFIKKIIQQAPKHLYENGKLFMETGKNHRNKISKLIDTKIWQNVKIEKDLDGFDRYLVAEKNG